MPRLDNTTVIAIGDEWRAIVRPESIGLRVCLELHHPDEPIDARYMTPGDAVALAEALMLAASALPPPCDIGTTCDVTSELNQTKEWRT